MRVQNLTDFSLTKLDSQINDPFLLNELGDPRFVLLFAKNSLIKNIFEEEKRLIGVLASRFQWFLPQIHRDSSIYILDVIFD